MTTPADGSRSTPTRAWSRSTGRSTTRRPPATTSPCGPPATMAALRSQAFTINVTDVNERCGRRVSDTDAAADAVMKTPSSARRSASRPGRRSGRQRHGQLLARRRRGRAVRDRCQHGRGHRRRGDRPRNGRQPRHHGPSHASDTSFSTRTLSIAVGDVDEFDTGAVSDTDATANTVAEDAIAGHRGRRHRPGRPMRTRPTRSPTRSTTMPADCLPSTPTRAW